MALISCLQGLVQELNVCTVYFTLSLYLVLFFREYGETWHQADVQSTGAGIECLYCILIPYPMFQGVGRDLVSDRRPVDWCRNWMSVLYIDTLPYVSGSGARPGIRQTSGRLVQELNVCTVYWYPTLCFREWGETWHQADVRSPGAGIKCLYCIFIRYPMFQGVWRDLASGRNVGK